MLKIELEIEGTNQTFDMPESWSDITVGQYEQIFRIDRDKCNQVEYIVEVFNCLTKIDKEIVYQFDIQDFKQITEMLSFTATPIEDNMKESIVIQDGDLEEEYFLKKDFKTLTMGESISIEALLEKHNHKLEQAISDLLCIFLRKKITTENGIQMLEPFKNEFMLRSDKFKKVNIVDVYQLFVFFSTGSKQYIKDMKDSLANPKSRLKIIKRSQDSKI